MIPDVQYSFSPLPGHKGYKVTMLLKDYMTRLLEESQQEDLEAIIKLIDAYADQFRKLYSSHPEKGMQAVIKAADDIIAATTPETKNQFQCQSGCTHCCYIDVDISQNEAATIINYCNKSGIDTDIEYLLKQAEKGRKVYSEFSRCTFLKENKCSIYPVRPMSCRKLYVFTDPSFCDSSASKVNQAGTYFDLHTEIYASALMNISETGPMERMLLKELRKDENN
jgi:Fe-S-cluster containining protein